MPDPLVCTFSFVTPFSYESEHTKLMTSLIINLLLAVFYLQSLSCEVIDKSQSDLNSSNSKYFPLCLPCLWIPGRFQLLYYCSKLPLTWKQLSFPWLSRNPLVFLRLVFSLVSSIYVSCKGIQPWIFTTQLLLSIFSTVVCSHILPVNSLVSAVSTIPCRVLQQNCKKTSMRWTETGTVGKYCSSTAAQTVQTTS